MGRARPDYAAVILPAIAAGKSRQEIADQLGITASAVCHWLRVRGLTKRQTRHQPVDDGETLDLLKTLADNLRPCEVSRIAGVTRTIHWRRWIELGHNIPRRSAERIRNYFATGRPDAVIDRGKTLRASKRAPKKYKATCLDCRRGQMIDAIDLTHARQPHCRDCGGPLELSTAAKARIRDAFGAGGRASGGLIAVRVAAAGF